MLPSEGWFPLLAYGHRCMAIYQRGTLDVASSTWTADVNGPHYLAVCSCGRGTYACDLDEAVSDLRRSYVLGEAGAHSHGSSAFPCNIIEASNDGEAGFFAGTIVLPELVPDLSSNKTSA